MHYKRTDNKGFTLIEFVLVLAASIALFFAFFISYLKFNAKYESAKRIEGIDAIGDLINNTAIKIALNVGLNCQNGYATCTNTNLYPIINGTRLIWNLDNMSDVVSLVRALSPCYEISATPNRIELECANLGITRMVYTIGGNTWTSIHTPGRDFDYLAFYKPSIVVTYNDKNWRGAIIPNLTRRISLDKSFDYLGKVTIIRIDTIKEALKNYATTKRFLEFQSTPNASNGVGGMFETDDFYIPWAWQILTPNQAYVNGTCSNDNCDSFCVRNNCVSKFNVWDTSINSPINNRALIFQRINTNLGLNLSDKDGFGNPLYVFPVFDRNRCNLNTCQAPPLPQRNYQSVAITLPPFQGLITTSFCYLNNNPVYNCFTTFIYPQ